MTPEQLDMARHALGLPNRARRSYRNRYFANKDGAGDRVWKDMVANGEAEAVRNDSAVTNRYQLTSKGALAVLREGERLCQEDFPGVAP